MPIITASTGASLRFGARRAELPWQNSTNSPMPAPTLSTATIVFVPARNLDGSLSSTNCGRSNNSLRPLMDGSFLVETTAPSTRARNIVIGLFSARTVSAMQGQRDGGGGRSLAGRFLRQNCTDVFVRARDDMNADQVAFDGFDSLGAGIGRGFNGRNITDDDRGDEGIANLGHGTDQFDIRRFQHRVRALDERDEAAGFNKSDC